MNVSIYEAAAAMNANARWQDIISNNLASSTMPGFKKTDTAFSDVQAGLMSQSGSGIFDQSHRYTLPTASGVVNFLPGETTPTANPTDLSIAGPGFFEVQMPNGLNAYTRNGEFSISPQGVLTTKAGQPVMGDRGPIQIDRANRQPVVITPKGEVIQGANNVGTIKIVEFDNLSALTPAGASYFLALDPDNPPRQASKSIVNPGSIESGNTTSIREMSSLINSMRLFEANQRIIQGQDDRMGRMISELGNPS